jgi:hypothetical protein
MIKAIASALAALCLAGCGTIFTDPRFGTTDPLGRPPTPGEGESGYTYIPIDPFPVHALLTASCKSWGDAKKVPPLLDSLPDNAVRMLVERFDSSGGVTYGASKVKASGDVYRVTVDYINADTINVQVWITKRMRRAVSGEYEVVDLYSTPLGLEAGSEQYEVTRTPPLASTKGITTSGGRSASEFNIPVYVGVGLRVAANVTVIAGDANISGLGVIGAEAEVNKLRGSLIVQTLGVNGKSVASALPIQNELNRTTAQNAIVAVGSIKALLYADETVKSPRVVGMYLPFPGGKPLVNALISELSKSEVEWKRNCLPLDSAKST